MNRACTIYFSEDHYPRSYCCAWATDSTLQVGGEAYSQTMSHVRCMSMSVSLTGLRATQGYGCAVTPCSRDPAERFTPQNSIF